MRIYDLECLLAVARNKSISKTAEELFIGQTTLSAIIRSIEKELNIKIFKRTSAGLTLTAQGENALLIAEDIVAKAQAFQTLSNGILLKKRIVHFLAYISATDFLMVYLSQQLRLQDNNIILHAAAANSRNILSKLKNTEANIGIGSIQTKMLAEHKSSAQLEGFTIEELYQDRFCLCVAAQSALAKQPTLTLPQLEGEHFAVVDHFPIFKGKPVAPLYDVITNYTTFPTYDGIKKAIADNHMVGLLPKLAFHNDIYAASGLIKLYPLRDSEHALTNYLIYPNDNHLTMEEKLILKLVRQFYTAL